MLSILSYTDFIRKCYNIFYDHYDKDDVIFEEEIKKSRFICHLKRVTTEAARVYQPIKKQHHKANHNVSAFTIGDHQEISAPPTMVPSGTAGVPMLEILKKRELTNLVAVVTLFGYQTRCGWPHSRLCR